MTEDRLSELVGFRFMESRIPPLDALSVFVPEGQQPPESAKETVARIGFSRWYPVAGGHKVLIPYEGGAFDNSTFSIEKGAWNHEHCHVCQTNIPAMTLCWVTEDGPYIILCVECKAKLDSLDGRQ
jgi:hypothetical protein